MRQVFFSFHYEKDNWRVQQIRNMGIVEGQKICSPNEWEQIRKNGNNEIKKWIDRQMLCRSCVIVLIGQESYGRKWINYEIKKAWEDNKGLFGIYIHNLKNKDSQKDRKGHNPFDYFSIGQQPLSHFIKTYNPLDYSCIRENLSDWIEFAIAEAKARWYYTPSK